MRYCSVKEIENIYNIEKVRNNARLLWYKIAEGYEIIPYSYVDHHTFISEYEKYIFKGWKFIINADGSLSLIRTIKTADFFIHIDKNGRETYKILALSSVM
ncbi:hypothetical protein ACNQFZ_18830 [Schinkia sp. CFF1]